MEGQKYTSASFADAIIRNAEFLADATLKALITQFPDTLTGQIDWPAAFLIEFGAVVQIGYWEDQGISAHRDMGFPTCDEATRLLIERCRQGSSAFSDIAETPICDQVLVFWAENLAWYGPQIIEAEIVVGDLEEDRYLDLLADFIWRHRDELQDFFRKEGEDDQ